MRVLSRESVRGLAAYFESLVHGSARGDALTIARHQSFIASRLLGGLLALLPGLIFWITVLGLFLLIRKIGRALGLGRMKGEPGTETA